MEARSAQTCLPLPGLPSSQSNQPAGLGEMGP